MDTLAGLLSLVSFVMALIALTKFGPLGERIARVERTLGEMPTAGRTQSGDPLGPALEGVEPRVARAAVGEPLPVPPSPVVGTTGTPAPDVTEAGPGVPIDATTPRPSQASPVPPLTTEGISFFSDSRQNPPGPSPFERIWRRMRGTDEWEALIGGRWMNRVGALALILGIGLFLRYAFDNNWIPPSARVAIGVGVGVGLLLLARRAHNREYAIFAQGLVGTGIAALYLSVYASVNFYHLVPASVGFAAMAVVTAVTLAQALWYDSLAVALLGWLGGFLALPLLGIGAGHDLGLISYVLSLDAAFLFIVIRRDAWFVLEPLSLGATYLAYSAWYLQWYNTGKLVTTGVALTLFWMVFYAADVRRVALKVSTYAQARQMLGVGNVILFETALLLLLRDHRYVLGAMTLALGAVYIAAILAIRRGLRDGDEIDARFTLTAIALAVLAVPILCTDYLIPILWAAEALALLWCGARWNLKYIWQPALCVYALASGALLTVLMAHEHEHLTPVLNVRLMAFVILAACCGAGVIVVRPLRSDMRSAIAAALHYVWCSTLLLLLAVEVINAFQPSIDSATRLNAQHLEFGRDLLLAAVWMVYSLLLLWPGLRWRNFPVVSSALATAALAVAVGFGRATVYQPIERYSPVLNIRVGAMVALTVGMILQLWWLRARRDLYSWIPSAMVAYQAALGLAGFELLTSEVHDYFRHATGGISEHGGASGYFVEVMLLAAIWMLYSLPLVHYGIRNHRRTLVIIGLGSAALAVGAAAVAAVAFVPENWLSLALTVRPLVLGFVLVGLFLLLRWIRQSDLHEASYAAAVVLALQTCIVLLGFELISTQTRDIFHVQIRSAQTLGVQATVDHLRNLEQLTLSITWLIYAILILVVGIWRRTRWLRLGALVLFGFVVLKVFVYDLSFLSSAYRSISFAGLGIILLSVSFLYQRYREVILGPSARRGATG